MTIRVGFGSYRSAVQADAEAGIGGCRQSDPRLSAVVEK
jgi:hypothetical protein